MPFSAGSARRRHPDWRDSPQWTVEPGCLLERRLSRSRSWFAGESDLKILTNATEANEKTISQIKKTFRPAPESRLCRGRVAPRRRCVGAGGRRGQAGADV